MLNKIQIIGRLGKDPEVRYTPGGEAVCNFSVATSERWKDKNTGEVKEETTWHRVSAWGRQAEIVGQYLVRGSLVYVEGKMTSRKYADKNGVEKESFEIRMQEMKMLSSREPGEQRQPAQSDGYPNHRYGDSAPAPRPAPAPAARPSSGFDDMDDDIPF
jgi:single-strand DNA-binding protein